MPMVPVVAPRYRSTFWAGRRIRRRHIYMFRNRSHKRNMFHHNRRYQVPCTQLHPSAWWCSKCNVWRQPRLLVLVSSLLLYTLIISYLSVLSSLILNFFPLFSQLLNTPTNAPQIDYGRLAQTGGSDEPPLSFVRIYPIWVGHICFVHPLF